MKSRVWPKAWPALRYLLDESNNELDERTLEKNHIYQVSDAIKNKLKKPMGELIRASDPTREQLSGKLGTGLLVTVGDKTTERFLEIGFSPALQVIDGIEKRAHRSKIEFAGAKENVIRASNPPGTITTEALSAFSKALMQLKHQKQRSIRIEIEGEEDLLVLPVLAFFPEGTTIAYGQPNEGLVLIKSNPDLIEFSKSILHEIGIESLEQ